MIRKAYWGGLASIFLALAIATGCSSTPATVTPAAVATVTAVTPFAQNTTLNSQFASPFSVTVMTGTTPVVGVTVTFTAPGAGAGGTFGTDNFATATTDATGTAISPMFTANGTIGTYIVIASAQSTQSKALFNLANTLEPEAVSTAGGTPQSTTFGTQFVSAMAVTVKDPSGNAVGAGLPVTFTAPDGYFTDTDANITTALTNASGVATAAPYVASGTVGGQYSVIASTVDTVDGDSSTASFTLSNTIMPATITPVAGTTPQSATAGTPFAIPLAVTVVDGTTPTPVPVSNALVTFAAPSFTVTAGVDSTSSGTFVGGGTSISVWTDASGAATAGTFTANSLVGGPYNVSATVVVQSGTTLSVNFALTNK
jgi:hypothetical protein